MTGFSVSTVSRVLNGKSEQFRISTKTAEIILQAATDHNYYPNRIARGLRLERTETIGLIIPDIANQFFSSIAKTIEIESRKNGYSIFLCDSLDDISTERELLNLLAGRKVDGIILAPVGTESGHINKFAKNGIPVVIIDRYLPETSIPYITTDSYFGACKATEHIISMGHRSIACIQGRPGISANTDRISGYKDTLKKNNISVDNSLIVGYDFGEENGYIQTKILLSKVTPPTAIFALSNLISLGAMRAIAEARLKIPDDISLVSFDDQPYSALLASPMTTVEQEKDEIAVKAVKILLERIINAKNNREITKIMIKPKLIIRKSVREM